MADQRAEALETVAAAKGQVNAARKESHKTCREIARLCTAPVAGPFIFTLLWLLSVFLVTVYFGWLCWSASSAWYQPVTVFDEVLKSELEYPDIYMCLPANTIEAVEQGAPPLPLLSSSSLPPLPLGRQDSGTAHLGHVW